jgi:hypothetical protein
MVEINSTGRSACVGISLCNFAGKTSHLAPDSSQVLFSQFWYHSKKNKFRAVPPTLYKILTIDIL